MKLSHYFFQRTAKSPFKSRYAVIDDNDNVTFETGSAVKLARFIRKIKRQIPSEMIGPQVRQYCVDLNE